ncbi:MAG: fumarylacetoacetase [Gemmatimonadales bacterium]
MTRAIDETHDPARRSWVAEANGHADFPIQNLPFGAFRRRWSGDGPRVGVAIGDRVLDVAGCAERGLLSGRPERAAQACAGGSLNELLTLGGEHWLELRQALSRLLAADGSGRPLDTRAGPHLLAAMSDVEMLVPADIGDYTDFYASVYHASNVGALFRPDNPLLPNYKWVPIGYHGRASSIVASGTPVRRPTGQTRPDPNAPPTFGPTRRLDYELEVGIFVGPGNPMGYPIPIADAERHMFGVCLVNDWSARDVQAWEYQPLGPFLAKNFATTVSPWVVTLEALAPFRAPMRPRQPEDPAPLPHLADAHDRDAGAIDLVLDVSLASAVMRELGIAPVRLTRSRFADLYWTPAQLLTHHASNGCNLRPGDLLASGTVSGPEPDSVGCLLELTRGGKVIRLPTGEERTFLADGDEVIFRGYCERQGAVRIGLGECRGMVTSYEARVTSEDT